MSQAPYSPLHPPRKEVSEQRMFEILAKHLPPGSNLPKGCEAQTPKAESAIALLEWLEPVKTGKNAGYVLTRCGRYSLTKQAVHGKAFYMAWARREPPHASIILGIRPTREEAEGLCRSDYERASGE